MIGIHCTYVIQPRHARNKLTCNKVYFSSEVARLELYFSSLHRSEVARLVPLNYPTAQGCVCVRERDSACVLLFLF